MLLSPAMQISQRLLVILLCYCPNIFAQVKLTKYVPPITASSPKLPETVEAIEIELRKQDSLLNQLHAEMNAGYVSKKREEQLWEVQRIITQLKRNLRAVKNQQDEKKASEQKQVKQTNVIPERAPDTAEILDKSMSDNQVEKEAQDQSEVTIPMQITSTGISTTDSGQNVNEIDRNSVFMVPETHAEYDEVRLQLENRELKAWKSDLQQRIGKERAELLHLKQTYEYLTANTIHPATNNTRSNELHTVNDMDVDYDHITENLIRENTLLDYKRQMLAKQIFDEKRECIMLQIEMLRKQQFQLN